MSLYDYQRSIEIFKQDEPFYALLMALIRQADTDNLARLELAFPEVVKEFRARYKAAFGVVYEYDKLTPEEYAIGCAKIKTGKWG